MALLHLVALVVNPTPNYIRLITFEMENLSHPSEAQLLDLDKLSALIGAEQVSLIVVQGPDVRNARLDAFLKIEAKLSARFMTT